MDIEELRASISTVISADACAAEFYFLLDVDDQIVVKKADLDGDAQDELKDGFLDSISESLLLNDDLSLVQLSSADDRANAVYRYDLEDVPQQLAQLSNILERDDFATFDFSDDALTSLKGIVVLLGHGAHQLALYKHQYPVALFKRDRGLFVRNRNENRLGKLTDDILRINSKFEFLKIGDHYYIVDIKALERFFGFHDAVKNMATQGIENIRGVDLVENLAALEGRIDDIAFARKLVRAASDSPVLGKIPNNQIVDFINTHPALQGKIGTGEDGTKLLLDTKKSQDLFLKLLNDDFLQSELTKRYYASLAKDAVQNA